MVVIFSTSRFVLYVPHFSFSSIEIAETGLVENTCNIRQKNTIGTVCTCNFIES